MATPTSHFLDLKLKLFAAIIGILVVSGSGQVTECGALDGVAVLAACQQSLEKEGPKVNPSSDCCKGVNGIGMACVCKSITKEIEDIISTEKLLFVAQSCGQPLQPGSSCGSFKVPPA